MDRTKKLLVAGALVLGTAGIGGATIAGASGGDDAEAPITGADLERASAAALAHTGEGTVTDTEVGDEESYYEVEVTLDDGSEVDVQLDESFAVVGEEVEAPGEEEDDDGEEADDDGDQVGEHEDSEHEDGDDEG